MQGYSSLDARNDLYETERCIPQGDLSLREPMHDRLCAWVKDDQLHVLPVEQP